MEKHHEHLYKMIENQYYFMADRVPVRQDNLFKTYLWLASLALGLNLAMLQKLGSLSFWSVAALCSLAVSFCVLVLALNSMRGSKARTLKAPDFNAYLKYLENPEYDVPLLARTLADDMASCLPRQIEIQSLRGLKLQSMSRLLILVFLLLAMAAGGFIFH